MAVAYRIYARALFDAAKDRDRLAQVREDLADFVAAVEEVPELRSLLRDPVLDPKEKAAALDSILGGVDELVRNFLLLVAEKNRTAQIEEIAHEFDRLVAAEERRLEVELTTAFELSDSEAKSIVAQIEEASGRQVDATRSVDPDLIGGLILQAGSMRVDASVRGRLNRLRQDLVTRS
ncbi:MAG: F-type H+-transporting ATPase subunit delta [Gaiellaceae bacterium]|jgi:F-type H+-transporting ATPase subunit delta|nr:F-type H+-transporting ATPase subunit delta [Gaiellaceae bacterium]